ncbi:hypothetical protein ABG067_004686 [Albugo candida]
MKDELVVQELTDDLPSESSEQQKEQVNSDTASADLTTLRLTPDILRTRSNPDSEYSDTKSSPPKSLADEAKSKVNLSNTFVGAQNATVTPPRNEWEDEVNRFTEILDNMLTQVTSRDLIQQTAEYILRHPHHSIPFQLKLKQVNTAA